MATAPVTRLTPEQYLELDSRSERPSEYYDGEVFPIVDGTTLGHSLILANLTAAVHTRLRKSPCRAQSSPVRVRLSGERFAYPDLFVVCGEPQMDDPRYQTVLNPVVIFEVLSPSTADFDLGGKRRMYCTIPSVKQYVAICQDQAQVLSYTPQAPGRWVEESLNSLDQTLQLESLGCEIPLAEIYERVEFESTGTAG